MKGISWNMMGTCCKMVGCFVVLYSEFVLQDWGSTEILQLGRGAGLWSIFILLDCDWLIVWSCWIAWCSSWMRLRCVRRVSLGHWECSIWSSAFWLIVCPQDLTNESRRLAFFVLIGRASSCSDQWEQVFSYALPCLVAWGSQGIVSTEWG